MKEKEPKFYLNLKCDSDEEIWFLYWVEELIQKNIVLQVSRGETFVLSDELRKEYIKTIQLKTKVKEEVKSKVILEGHSYTHDFNILWNIESPYYFRFKAIFEGLRTHLNMVEVKPCYDKFNMTRSFKINQKWVYDKYNVLIDLVLMPEFFGKSFTPDKYLLTSTGKTTKKKINFQLRTLEEFLTRDFK